jgi:hypothetical protein
MDTALIAVGAVACPLGMLAMMAAMGWMMKRTGSHDTTSKASRPHTPGQLRV